jgi:hypothetical protein
MMKKPKPQVAVVFGILHIVFGGLGVVCNLCGVGGLAMIYVVFNNLHAQASPAEKKELEDLWQRFNDDIPGYIAFVITDLGGSMLLGLVLLIAGIGLLGVKHWARHLSVIWSVVRIIFVVALLVINVAFVQPGMQKFTPEFQRWMERMQKRSQGQGQGAPQQPGFGGGLGGTGNPVVDNILSFVGAGISAAYAVVVLIFMLRPATAQGFVRYHSSEEDYAPPREGPQDYFDEDYERRRRELPPPEPPPGPQPFEPPPPGPLPPS